MGCVLLRLAVALALAWSAAIGVAAETSPDFYWAKTLVTGQTEEGRGPAIVRCFTDVLVKVSGDARLLDDPRIAGVAKQAGALVKDFRYRDLMAGLPIHDEQGTRDRPYELTATFDPGGIDAILRSLGRKPWAGPRPRVVVLLEVRHGATSYALTGDGDRGAVMRDALAEAAARVGLPTLLPGAAAETRGSVKAWLAADRRSLYAVAGAVGGDLALVGRLVWSERALGWVADWRLDWQDKTHRWRIRGVSFDEAFRYAMRRTVQAVSGHG